ncbi:glycosyltransferase family 2 protein [Rhodobacteraceae bacterium NNCM2]|nr:glycosyltransferase family 2 protein [Coraliihabitans acroporae]
MVAIAEPATGPEKVLILIPTLNEADHIEDVLGQLLSDEPYAAECLTIVADGGSDDGTRSIVERLGGRYPKLELRHNADRIQAAAVNLALDDAFAGFDILIRCDAHASYPPGFVSSLVAELDARPDAASVVIPMDAMAGEGCFQRGLAWVADTPLGAGGSPHRGGQRSGYVDHGHHAAFRLSMYRQLGGYDTGFVANEDAEYDRRVTDAGGRIWLAGAIRIGYFPRRTARSLFKQYWRYGIGRAQTCLKHRVKPALRQLIPVAHVLALAVSAVLLPFSALGLVWPLVYAAVVIFTGLMVAFEHRSPCGLHAATAVAVMHFAWGCGFLCGLAKGVPPTGGGGKR